MDCASLAVYPCKSERPGWLMGGVLSRFNDTRRGSWFGPQLVILQRGSLAVKLKEQRITMFIAGMTFFITVDPHLWVIISDTQQSQEEVVYVNFTTFYEGLPPDDPRNDRSCVLDVGDHPFITRPTIIFYGGAHIASVAHLAYRYETGRLKTCRDPVSIPILDKIRLGAANSQHIPPEATDILAEQHLI